MEATLHHYCFNTENSEERGRWLALKAKLEPTHKQHSSHSGHPQPITFKNEAEGITLDPSFLFNDQWNEAGENGRRLFDWYLQYRLNGKYIKQGHYLELTQEMTDIRDNTAACGYCGKHEPVGKFVFCPHCMGSEYLEDGDLFLLRMLPVSRDKFTVEMPKLSESEEAELLPKYRVAQGLGLEKREQMKASKNRRTVAELIPTAEAKAAESIAEARIKTEAYTWLLDQELNILDNVIYYDHTKTFCFGWRKGLTSEEKETLSYALGGFPFIYTLK